MNKRREEINTLITRYYRYFAVALFLILGFLFWQFLFAQQYESLQTSGVLQHTKLLDTIAQREQYLVDLQTMEANYATLDHRLLRDLSTVLPSDYTSADVFTEIEQLFSGTELSVRSVNVATVGTATTIDEEDEPVSASAATQGLSDVYDVVQITVNASAISTVAPADAAGAASVISYNDFKSILTNLEQYRHLMNLEQLVYTPGSDNFTLILKTYQQKQPLLETL